MSKKGPISYRIENMKEGKFLFLGTGASMGIPVIGCTCRVCSSLASQNKRLRPSGLIEARGKRFLIDVGPDFREQALKFGITHLDGLLLTHVHFDHIAGIDDLRAFYFIHKTKIPCLLSKETLEDLKIRYHYLFRPMAEHTTMSAQIEFEPLETDFGEVDFQGIRIKYMSYFQGKTKVTGFRLGDFAYVSDIRTYTDELIDSLKGVNTLVVSALRERLSPVHFSVNEAVEFAQKIGAKKTYFTHIAHELDHVETNKKLPPGIELGYDGQQFHFRIE